MTTLDIEPNNNTVANVEFDAGEIIVTLSDGRRIATPLRWYPKLAAATDSERTKYEVMPFGVHWPTLDEDLSVAGMFRGEGSPGGTDSKSESIYSKPLPEELTSLLKPFSQHQPIQTNQVRLQRIDVLVDIASRARATLDREGLYGGSVPNKFLVPFLEKASLEDWASELRDAWANLLFRAATKYDTKLNVYVDILSKISAREAQFLQRVYYQRRSTGGFPWPEGPFQSNAAAVQHSIGMLVHDHPEPNPASVEELHFLQRKWRDYITKTKLDYGLVLHGTIVTPYGTRYFYNTDDFAEGAGVIIDILERERLLKRTLFAFGARLRTKSEIHNPSGSVGYVELTFMGFDFVRVCTGEDRKIGKSA